MLEAGSYREAFLGCLRGRDPTLVGGAVRVLSGFLLNKSVDFDLLDVAGAETLLRNRRQADLDVSSMRVRTSWRVLITGDRDMCMRHTYSRKVIERGFI